MEGQDAKACLIYMLNFIKKSLNGPMTPRAKLIMLSIASEWISARLALARPESYGGLIVQLGELIGQPVPAGVATADEPGAVPIPAGVATADEPWPGPMSLDGSM